MTEITLPKNGTTARMEILDSAVLPEVLALQEAARNALPANKRHFIRPQTTATFQNLLMRLIGVMIGVRAEGKLIAQMALIGPMELREAIALRYITGNDVPFPHASLTDNVVIFKSTSVHPDWQGNDLPYHLVGFALSQPVACVADHVFARASVDDKNGWDMFARHGFGIVSAAYDPADGQPRFIMQKPSFGFDCDPAPIADAVDPATDFPAIVRLTQREALIGLYDAESEGKLAFMRSRETLNLMPTVARVSTHK